MMIYYVKVLNGWLFKSVIAFSILYFSGCYSSNNNNEQIEKSNSIVLDINKQQLENIQKQNFSELVEEKEIVVLETKKGCIISGIRKVVVEGEIIFVLDKNISQSLSLFNREGKHIRKIGKIGRGPNELEEISDFSLNESTNEVLLLDGVKKIVYIFNMQGHFISKFTIPFYADFFEHIDKNIYVFHGSGHEDRVIIFDREDNKILKSYVNYSNKNSVAVGNTFHKFGESVFYTEAFCDTIFKVSSLSQELEKSRIIDFGSYSVRDKDLIPGLLGSLDAKVDRMSGVRMYCETQDFIYFAFDYNLLNPSSPYYVLYNKATNHKLIYSNQTLNNNVTFSRFPPQIMNSTRDGFFISYVSAIQIVSQLDKLTKKTNIDPKLLRLKYDDNPVILINKFKNF